MEGRGIKILAIVSKDEEMEHKADGAHSSFALERQPRVGLGGENNLPEVFLNAF
jgi:hypothetical protein